MKAKNAVLLLLCIALALLLTAYSPLASQGARDGLALCGRVIIPSLYPFMVVGNIFTQLSARKPSKKSAFGAVLLGLIGGYPMGAKTAASLMEQGAFTRAQAQRMQLFCVNAGPAYLLGAVGSGLLGNRRAGVLLLTSLTAASLVMAFLSRFYEAQNPESEIREHQAGESPQLQLRTVSVLPPDASLLQAVANATASCLGICAWVVLFSSLCALLRLLPHTLWPAIPSLHVLLEVSSGAAAVVRGGAVLPVLCAALGWGGLSVHCQILGDLRKTGLPLKIFLVSRLAHGAIAAAICWQLGRWFPVERSAAVISGTVQNARLWAVSAPAAAALLFFCAFLILDLDLRRKI